MGSPLGDKAPQSITPSTSSTPSAPVTQAKITPKQEPQVKKVKEAAKQVDHPVIDEKMSVADKITYFEGKGAAPSPKVKAGNIAKGDIVVERNVEEGGLPLLRKLK